MSHSVTRRQFVQTTAATIGAGYFVAAGLTAQESKSPNERIRFGCIGVGGKGSSDSDDAGRHGDVVAICDVDEGTLGGGAKRFPKATKFTDFRKMLEEMHDKLDAVTVSTPDHCHAPASLMAMRMKKHCFTQKPMTHTIYEARLMGKVARENNLATMMGNQGTAESGLRHAAALLQKGILGKVSEVHVWTNRPIWPQGGERPTPEEPPKALHWNEWLGPAKERPYGKGYHTFAWRGWWDFGTGALGDMACHTVNMPFMGLGLRDPSSVQATTSGHNGDSYPKWSIITFEFPATEKREALKFHWYDGGKRPPKELFEGRNASGSGSLIVGEKGKIYSPDDYGAQFYMLGGLEKPDADFVKSPGHFQEWVRAI
jgi:predicted dehydrogenase